MSSDLHSSDPRSGEEASAIPAVSEWHRQTPLGAAASELAKSRTEVAALRAALAAETRRADEFAHRNRNLLGVVAALVRRTMAEVEDLDTARQALEAMQVRLAAAHEAGRQGSAGRDDGTHGEPVGAARGLHNLAHATMAAFETGAQRQIAIAGPPVALGPAAERLLPLVFFELATNAVKHGVLRCAAGRITLSWALAPDGELRLRWREHLHGGAPVAASGAAATGAGGSALMRALREDLGGVFASEVRPDGFVMDIAVPARHLDRMGEGAERAPDADGGAEAANPAGGTGEAPAEPRAPELPGRVLVVEDNPLIADDLATLVRGAGVPETAIALDLAEARSALAAGSFDLVMLDVTLGEDRADDLLPSLAETAVVVVSGRSRDELPPAFAGRPLLTKPFQPEDVAAALAGWVAR